MTGHVSCPVPSSGYEGWAELIAALERIGVRSRFVWLGGGCVCLELPLSEDGTRWVWLGSDEDGYDPMNVIGPLGAYMGGCAYWQPDEDPWQLPLTDLVIDPADPDGAARAVRGLLTETMTTPFEEYECV